MLLSKMSAPQNTAAPVYKLEKDLCRCCHAEGSFFNFSDTVYNSGQVEVYSDMMQSTLGVNILPMDGDVNMMTFTICGQCVLRLRDAHNFKQQVIECEQRFKGMYSNMVLADRKTINIVQIKEEDDAAETFQEDIKIDVEANSGNDYHWKSDHSEEEPEVKIKFVSKSKRKPKSKRKQTPPKRISVQPLPETSRNSEDPENSDAEVPWWHRDAKPPKGPRSNSSMVSSSPPPHTEEDTAGGNKKGPCRLPRQAIQVMKEWLAQHVGHPYPSEPEKDRLAAKTNLTLVQVNNWFINARRRILPMLEEDEQSEPERTPVEGTDFRFEGENCVCCHCGKVYLRFGSNDVLNHIKWEHFMIPRYTCQECGLGFTKEAPLISHKMHEHHIDERKKCPECDALCNTKHLLEYHMRTIHQMSKKMKCDFCEFETYSKQMMRVHNLNHKDEKNYPCKQCGKAFKLRKTLKQHEYIHSREKKIVCGECGKGFAQRGSITYHMSKYHPGVKF